MQQQGVPQQDAPREEVPPTSAPGRGRGRGGRGRGRGQSTPAPTQQPTQNPSVPHIVTRLSAGTQPIVKPENSYYVIDLVNIVSLFWGFATFIVSQSRRGGWPLGEGYYAGLMIYAFAAKLQRVGIASNQINPPNSHYLEVVGLELPTSIVTLIDQFGEKVDLMGVRIAPYVSNLLITTLARFSFLLANIHCDHVQQNPHNGNWVNNNKYNLMVIAYTPLVYGRIAISRAAARLGTSCVLGGARSVDLNRTVLQMLVEYCVNSNVGQPTPQEVVTILANAQNQNTAGPFVAVFDVGAQPLVAAGNIPVPFVAAFNDVRAAYLNNAPIYPNANDGYVDATSVATVPGGWTTCYTEVVELAHRYMMSPVSTSASGSFAPTVVSSEEGGQLSGYSVVSGLTPLEWNLGLVIGADPTFITRDGIPFNVSDRTRRQARYSVPPIGMSYDNLTTAYIRESLRTQRL